MSLQLTPLTPGTQSLVPVESLVFHHDRTYPSDPSSGVGGLWPSATTYPAIRDTGMTLTLTSEQPLALTPVQEQ